MDTPSPRATDAQVLAYALERFGSEDKAKAYLRGWLIVKGAADRKVLPGRKAGGPQDPPRPSAEPMGRRKSGAMAPSAEPMGRRKAGGPKPPATFGEPPGELK